MTMETEKFTVNVNKEAMAAIREEARAQGIEASALIQRAIHKLAIDTEWMDKATSTMLKAQYKTIDKFVELSKVLFATGRFDEHFVLTVFQAAMEKPELKAQYERAIGGDAYAVKLPGKTPLNMYLGWYIKNAIGAEPKVDANNQPVRAQVRGEPIQSYTLLRHSGQ
ncbi:hypothetical protein EN925_00890 [Mesorhizobium sp. M7A.F.Ca.US.006.04.2.1]|uniref:hypothetical protein n=1 Tax=unclassified Mesorhizobium TaxID=325217 RepID=UPI000FC9F01C|nr:MULTISPECIES: hypothetical protein [unclassified Mesorhizobium]RUX73382.1 hypothetical protein EN990_21620 [Mesorhizobium sp. M7A.F.Ca.US.005.03.1.1]RUY19359.1 hypothetical protein EN991_00600 [Mesorhizobium sp. M7A.F.Ca.US.005.03.2.1]RVA96646.1 hypothetical protein EN925_00890 [Mesorhizobium sp. M7A.F.Ca.US.006.04.2.1]